MNDVALIIIYNHRYDKNIDIIEKLYKDRFSYIYHLVPFYNGNKANVIPTYESSYYFQGYIAQGFKSFFHERFSHYFFLGDDVLLNPKINERNYIEHLRLKESYDFLPNFINITEAGNTWPRFDEAFAYNPFNSGAEVEKELPDRNSALESFKKHGLEIKSLSFKQKVKREKNWKWYNVTQLFKIGIWNMRSVKNRNKTYNLPYPVVGSYADIFVISSKVIKQFCHYCGVFAATNLFVELAIPTALVLTSDNIITESEISLKGQVMWTENDSQFLEKYNKQLKELLNDFPSTSLYIHPIKLSKWNV